MVPEALQGGGPDVGARNCCSGPARALRERRMVDVTRAGAEALLKEMGIDAAELQQRRAVAGLAADDGARIASLRKIIEPKLPELVDGFFGHLEKFGGAKGLREAGLLEQARSLKLAHLNAMFTGDHGFAYATERVRLAQLYSRAGLPQHLFLGAYQGLLESIGRALAAAGRDDAYGSVRKLALFDIALTVDVLIHLRERIINRQQEAIRELSVPVLKVRERMLLLPLIGVMDTHRARLVTENLLHSIREERARVVVIDVTGMANVDTKVAHHLLQTIAAARLMGARVVVTGLSPEISQALVLLGIDLSRVMATGDLQSGIEEAEHVNAEAEAFAASSGL
jgi:rsbT co-antagonist protein RsbR